jgi:ketosteroid isomerase-like protein
MALTAEQAEAFAAEWMAAWNAHDLERILSHYADGVQFHSPFVVQIAGEPSGRLIGKERLRAYFGEALKKYPDLKFTLLQVLTGVSSVTLYYRSVKDLSAAEVMRLDNSGKVVRVDAHYAR